MLLRVVAAMLLARHLPAASLKLVLSFDLPGPPGLRFDYLTINYEDRQLFSSHLAAGLLHVIDLKTHRIIKSIPGVPKVEGVEYVPGLKKVYTSNWGDNTIGVIDLRRMAVVKRLVTESKPDGSAYAEHFSKLYVSDEHGKAVAVVDVKRDEIVRTLRFNSETGMPQYDPAARKIYVNLQDVNEFAVINPEMDAVVARYGVGSCIGNHGMAVDPAGRRAFLACEGNLLLTVFDLVKHEPIAYIPLPQGPDVVKFDPGLKRIYVACSSGAITVIQQETPDRYRKLEDFPVEKKIHSLAVDVTTHRVYAPAEQVAAKPAAKMFVFDAVR